MKSKYFDITHNEHDFVSYIVAINFPILFISMLYAWLSLPTPIYFMLVTCVPVGILLYSLPKLTFSDVTRYHVDDSVSANDKFIVFFNGLRFLAFFYVILLISSLTVGV